MTLIPFQNRPLQTLMSDILRAVEEKSGVKKWRGMVRKRVERNRMEREEGEKEKGENEGSEEI